MGLVYAGMFAATKSLALPMITHTVFDLTAVALIHGNWETEVASWLFG